MRRPALTLLLLALTAAPGPLLADDPPVRLGAEATKVQNALEAWLRKPELETLPALGEKLKAAQAADAADLAAGKPVFIELIDGKQAALLNKLTNRYAVPGSMRNKIAKVLDKRRRTLHAFVLRRFTKKKLDEFEEKYKALVEVWERPVPILLEADKGMVKDFASVEPLEKVRALFADGDGGGLAEKVKALRAKHEPLLVPRTHPASRHSKLHKANAAIVSANDKADWLSPAEREQLRLTNDHRGMLALKALRASKALSAAARGHSEYMVKSGTFAHTIKGHPLGATQQQRAAKHGYQGVTGENIFTGSSEAAGAHRAWLRSPGHHRNILDKRYLEMGVGLSGQMWTQMFGFEVRRR